MLRYLGAAMLLCGCAAMGLAAADQLNIRVRELENFLLSLRVMERELTERLTPLPELLHRAADSTKGSVKEYYLLCFREVEQGRERPFSQIWRESAQCVKFHLDGDARVQLESLGDVLGRYDVHSQRDALHDTREQLARSLERAQLERERSGRVYKIMGLACGALLVIALL